MPSRKLYQIIKDAELVTDIVPHRFPTSVQRHYERLTAFPERLWSSAMPSAASIRSMGRG